MSDLADNAAAISAGFVRTQTDAGANAVPRYRTHYSKPLAGAADEAGREMTADGVSTVSQAAADASALAALNGQRGFRYGTGAAAGKSGHGASQTFDVT